MTKKIFTFILALFAIATTAGAQVEINTTNFPDAFFRSYVSGVIIDRDKDGYLSGAEIAAVKEILVIKKNIANLQGIEHFTALVWLSCYYNDLTSLDVSKNTALTELWCFGNQLTSLDVSKNTALTLLQCSNNQLTSLDLSKNTALERLYCYNNQLTSLDLSKNTALTKLYCYNNQLTSLDLSKNTALTELYCYNNQLTSLNVSANTALRILRCSSNQLTSLDLSKNTALTELWCDNNQLTSLDVSKNTALRRLDCYGNQIKGDKMQALVNSLPTVEGEEKGKFYVINTKNENEKNVITKSQVAIAKGKGWTVYDYNGGSAVEYEGSDDTTGIGGVEADALDKAAWYTLDGKKLSGEPTRKGVYIYKGRKVVK